MAEERFEDKQLAKKDEAKIKGEAVEEKANPHEHKAEEKAAPAKAEAPKAAKKAEKAPAKDEKPARKVVLERKYTVNLTDAYAKPKYKRTDRAISLLRDFCLRHMKGKDVKLDVQLNNAIRKSARPTKKVQVVLQKDERGTVFASLVQAG